MNTDDIFASGKFFTGCNYWAGHAGMMMWRDWRREPSELMVAYPDGRMETRTLAPLEILELE